MSSSAPTVNQAPPTPSQCLNCGQAFGAERPRFCPACGQETHVLPPTLAEFAQQFGGAYFSTEGALWRTLKLLVTQPGELTRQYLLGRRKHYVLPLRLYLTASVVLLLVTRLLGGVEVVRGVDGPTMAVAEKTGLKTLMLDFSPLHMGIREGVFVCEGLPSVVCQLIHQRAAPDTHTLLNKIRLANERVVANFGAVMFVLLPLFAGCLKLVNWRSGLRYTAHLVFALHLHAFWFLVLALMRLSWAPLTWAGIAAMVGYTLLAGRRVYAGGLLLRLLRSTALATLYVGLLVLTVPVAWLMALLA